MGNEGAKEGPSSFNIAFILVATGVTECWVLPHSVIVGYYEIMCFRFPHVLLILNT